jgi:serine/threonine protein kinase
MDRKRLIRQIKSKGISVGLETLKILRELGSGGNGVAFLCQVEGTEPIVAKVYIPPDSRDLDERAYKRFKNEISLISKLQHPNVIKAFNSGTIQIGAYNLPFYTMPFAPSTLRQEVTNAGGPHHLERKLRIFVRALLGVAALHSNGIVHRDLKPENILISRDGVPWVADLGIARISAQLATTGLKTVASERLRNQDYYAPEQRFGKATDVDHRADIYALGCILYELLSGRPPVRTNSPKLKTFSEAFVPLDPIVDRMTAFDPAHRYAVLEDVLEELSITIGGVLVAHESGGAPITTDLPTMIKLIKSSNDAFRQKGVEIARRIGLPALTLLHELLGSARREVRNSAATALGYIAAPDSLPYLISALYGNTDKASRFRPSADTASSAIARFPISDRLKAMGQISQLIKPTQVLQIVEGMKPTDSYEAIESLAQKKLILLDWQESVLECLVKIDEAKAWPQIKNSLERNEIRYGFAIRRFIKDLSLQHQIEFIRIWTMRENIDGYELESMVNLVLELKLSDDTRLEFLRKLEPRVLAYRGGYRDIAFLKQRVAEAIARLGSLGVQLFEE